MQDWLLVISGLLVVCFGLGFLNRRLGLAPWPPIVIFVAVATFGIAVSLATGPYTIGADGQYYDETALAILAHLNGESPAPETTRYKEAWPALIAGLYWINGYSPLSVVVLNSTAIALTATFTAKSARLLSYPEPRWLLVAFFCLSPFVLIYGPTFGREATFFLGTSLLTLGVIYMFRASTLKGLVSVAIGAAIVLVIRFTFGLFLVYATLIPATFVLAAIRFRGGAKSFVAWLAVGFALILSVPFGMNAVSEYTSSASSNQAGVSAAATSGFVEAQLPEDTPAEGGTRDVANLSGVDELFLWISSNLNQFGHVTFGPFPQEIEATPLGLFLASNWVFWMTTLALAILALVFKFNRVITTLSFVAVALILMLLAYTLGNYGLVSRFRAVPILILAPTSLGVLSLIFKAKFRPSEVKSRFQALNHGARYPKSPVRHAQNPC